MSDDRIATQATCQHCGAAFRPRRQTKGLYCSRDCWYASEEARRPTINCEHCGKPFRLPPKDIRHGIRCCSKKCNLVMRKVRGEADRKPIEERFWAFINKTETCWLWIGALDWHGYGKFFRERGKSAISAHRFSYELAYGSIPEGQGVLHRCDTPACVRPDHLFLGDARANAQDAASKDRTTFGERNPMTKVTCEQVLEIVRRCEAGETYARIAPDYDMSPSGIGQIARGETWARTTGIRRS